MIQKKRVIAAGKKYFLGLMAVVGVVSALWCQSLVSLADTTGTITASSAIIRKDTNTNSDALGSVPNGTTVSITDEVQDSSGRLWYQVSVNGQTGYIRSDLMSKTDDGESSPSDGSQTASGASVEPDTVLDAQYAVISAETINVRTAPATNEGVVDKLNKNAQVVVSGESQGSDGKKWYYVTFTGTGGALRSGFIRSDLLSLGEMVPVPEEEAPEPQEIEPEPEVVVNNDYELYYNPTADESDAWLLYDNTDPTQRIGYSVKDLLRVTQARSANDAADAKTLVRQRVAIVALVVLAVLLIVVIVIMALKLRDIYYEDDEDEEEEAQEETPTQRRRRTQEDEGANTQRRRRAQEDAEMPTQRRRREGAEETSTQRRRRTEESEDAPVRRRRRMEDAEEETERSVRRRPVRDERGSNSREIEYREGEAGSAPVQTAPKRKAKNFLLDDDEFEFEFLNMEDKG